MYALWTIMIMPLPSRRRMRSDTAKHQEELGKMNKEFFEALAMLEKEKGIPMQYLIEKIEAVQ